MEIVDTDFWPKICVWSGWQDKPSCWNVNRYKIAIDDIDNSYNNTFVHLLDATFTHENVSAVLASVPTRNLSSVLWIPESRLKQIQTLSPSEIDERINLINYFLKCSVLAEWSSLAGLLYFYQHLVPLAAAKKFITTACGIYLAMIVILFISLHEACE